MMITNEIKIDNLTKGNLTKFHLYYYTNRNIGYIKQWRNELEYDERGIFWVFPLNINILLHVHDYTVNHKRLWYELSPEMRTWTLYNILSHVSNVINIYK